MMYGFERVREQEIHEMKTRAELFRHLKTGAELLSLMNEDENKVFGISFSTPPSDSTGLPHILEHSVLCGSRKYPVKEPFAELLKGSLQTFLNAMTYPDKTCYPVASQNLKDFYNLVDVYLDAVFYPRITPFVFQQEGWHFDLERAEDPLIYKGVVYNEMKGAYSSPDTLLYEYSQQSLFPDTVYGFDAGGDPGEIPNLTFEDFKAFHKRYYHPSNALIYFYGDDPPEERLAILNEYLKDFEQRDVGAAVSMQPSFSGPRRLTRTYAAGGGPEGAKGMITVNWMLDQSTKVDTNLAFHILQYILLGMPGSPLRKALIDSKYGEDIAGAGLATELRQMYFSTGLKGIDPGNADSIEALILDTLEGLLREGIDPKTVEAAMNTIEFGMRENNSGSFPRGLLVMFRALNTWLYGGDPLALVAFEAPLLRIKSELASNPSLFEGLIDRFFLKNPHRTTLILNPDPDLGARKEAEEQKRLLNARATMDQRAIQKIIAASRELKHVQETPDPSEALATIPLLKRTDLDPLNRTIPLDAWEDTGAQILVHDLSTNGIAYLDLGLDLHALPQACLPYAGLFGRALLEMGTDKEDFVALSQRISRTTGGIYTALFTSDRKEAEGAAIRLFLRGKAMTARTQELLHILRDVLLGVQLDNQERFHQMVLEAKARQEQSLVPSGHQMVNLRLRAHFTEADWAAEQMRGISYLLFLRQLIRDVEDHWPDVLSRLQEVHRILINRNAMLLNITLDGEAMRAFQKEVHLFLEILPAFPVQIMEYHPEQYPAFEGMTIPSQVNYVGKGVNLFHLGYRFQGTSRVITRYLRNAWLWERVRMQGGAYGAFCLFDRLSGALTFVSYRDPNLAKTLSVFDQSAAFLRELELSDDELTKSIIGAIGDMDKHMLPDAKGYTSMLYHLTGETDDDRQRMREEVLNTSLSDFRAFGETLESMREEGLVKVLGSKSAIEEAMKERPGWLEVVDIL